MCFHYYKLILLQYMSVSIETVWQCSINIYLGFVISWWYFTILWLWCACQLLSLKNLSILSKRCPTSSDKLFWHVVIVTIFWFGLLGSTWKYLCGLMSSQVLCSHLSFYNKQKNVFIFWSHNPCDRSCIQFP